MLVSPGQFLMYWFSVSTLAKKYFDYSTIFGEGLVTHESVPQTERKIVSMEYGYAL